MLDESTENFWDPAETTVFRGPPPAVAAARASMVSAGVHLMSAAAAQAHFGTGEEERTRFARHREDLSQAGPRCSRRS